jgi:hypothetical protein
MHTGLEGSTTTGALGFYIGRESHILRVWTTRKKGNAGTGAVQSQLSALRYYNYLALSRATFCVDTSTL